MRGKLVIRRQKRRQPGECLLGQSGASKCMTGGHHIWARSMTTSIKGKDRKRRYGKQFSIEKGE